MKITVIGASRGTGALAVEEALRHGHEVTAFARHPEKLEIEHPSLLRVSGDFHDADSVDAAIAGRDAVIVTASATSLKGFKENPSYFSQGTALVIDSMKRHNVRRLLVLSAFGVGESRASVGFLVRKLVVDGLLRRPFRDHERQERQVKESGLEWVIVRPSRLTDGPALGKSLRKIEPGPVPSAISRADVADFLVAAAERDDWVEKAVHLGG